MSLANRILALASARRDEPSARREIEALADEVGKLEATAKDSAYASDAINRRRLADKKRQVQYRLDRKAKRAAEKLRISYLKTKDSEVKKVSKRRSMIEKTGDLFGNLPAPADGWPEDYATQFWDAWPSHHRKHSEKQVCEKLARIRRNGGIKIGRTLKPVSWAQIWDGLTAYLASNPEHRFIPCPLVWINQARWTAHYSPQAQPARRGFGQRAFGARS